MHQLIVCKSIFKTSELEDNLLVIMLFFRPEIGGANSKRNAQLVLIPPILTRYSNHLKNKTVGIWTGQQMRNER